MIVILQWQRPAREIWQPVKPMKACEPCDVKVDVHTQGMSIAKGFRALYPTSHWHHLGTKYIKLERT